MSGSSRPVEGGECNVSIGVDTATLSRLTPTGPPPPRGKSVVQPFRVADRHPRAGPRDGTPPPPDARHHDPLTAETLSLELIRHTPSTNTFHALRHRNGRPRKIVDRAELILHSDLSRRWTLKMWRRYRNLSVYLTHVFRRVERYRSTATTSIAAGASTLRARRSRQPRRSRWIWASTATAPSAPRSRDVQAIAIQISTSHPRTKLKILTALDTAFDVLVQQPV